MIVSFLFVFGHFGHMFFYNYLGQKVIDHSSDVFHRMYVTYIYQPLIDQLKILEIFLSRAIYFAYMRILNIRKTNILSRDYNKG